MWRCCTVAATWRRCDCEEQREWSWRTKCACTLPAYLKLYHPEVTKYRCDSMKYMFKQLASTLGPVIVFVFYLYEYAV